MEIKKARGYEILDSRGNPTVMAEVLLADGTLGRASVPSGASTGENEALELRDGTSRYNGLGVKTAVKNIKNEISPMLKKLGTSDQSTVDRALIELDGTEDKSRLGANAVLAVSLATARAAAASHNMPLFRYLGGVSACVLPVPMMNILNGGAHAANNVDIQEFMIAPKGAKSFAEALRIGSEIYHELGRILKKRGLSCGVGDEGGFAPNLASDEEAIELILCAIDNSGFDTDTVKIAIDAAASEWQSGEGYELPKKRKRFSSDELIDYWKSLCSRYPIYSIEDPLGENDWDGWKRLTMRLGGSVQLVGDDLFVTNTKFLNKGIENSCGNSILVKYNQIGTLTEAINAVRRAKRAGFSTIVSHRSGETEDTAIADLSVAINSGQIKSGAPCRTDRTAKFNRLLRIEAYLNGCSFYG